MSSLSYASAAEAAELPSFPGAEGFGAAATGGRGGQVIKVTTLASGGPGSLQAALDTPGPRIIVFEVSGVISGDQTVEHGDVTIAGQTAPGAGITIAGRFYGAYSTSVNNIVVRHLRVRPSYSGGAGAQFDAMQFSRNSQLMFDHISVAWGLDETIDLYEARDVTLQWSTIEESSIGGHYEGEHNYGLINGPNGKRVSVHHNLFAHHKNRCPALANGPAEVRNNIMYNVRHGFVHHNAPSGDFNIVGNVFIQGPNDSLIPFWFDGGSGSSPSYYLADNFVDDPGDYVGVVENPWQTPFLHSSFSDMYRPESYRSLTEHDFSGSPGYVPVSTQSCAQTRLEVLDQAGAFPHDAVTLRTLDEVHNNTGSWDADPPSDLLTGLTPASAPADLDDDGMADAWESAHGLDPADPNDHGTIMPSGYTAIEEYINGLADQLVGIVPPPAPGGEGGAGDMGGSGSEGGSESAGGSGSAGGDSGGLYEPGAVGGAGGGSLSGPELERGGPPEGLEGCQVGASSEPASSLLLWLGAMLGGLSLARRRRAARVLRG